MTDQLLTFLKNTDLVLSRTSKHGVVDTTASPTKKSGLKQGEELTRQIQTNRSLISDFISWQKCTLQSSAECTFALVTIANLAGLNLLSEGLLRKWAYHSPRESKIFGSSVKPTDIPEGLLEIGNQAERLQSIMKEDDKLELIAHIEWELGVGPLHPFYDGCGRISRYFSALISLWTDTPLVRHQSRDEYFQHARGGEQAFAKYFLTCERKRLA